MEILFQRLTELGCCVYAMTAVSNGLKLWRVYVPEITGNDFEFYDYVMLCGRESLKRTGQKCF